MNDFILMALASLIDIERCGVAGFYDRRRVGALREKVIKVTTVVARKD